MFLLKVFKSININMNITFHTNCATPVLYMIKTKATETIKSPSQLRPTKQIKNNHNENKLQAQIKSVRMSY